MAKARKTFSIAKVLYEINQKNARSTVSPEVRQGWNSLLESILIAAEVYSGFGYLESTDVPEGERPGIRFRTVHGADLSSQDYYDRLTSDHLRDRQAFHRVFGGDEKTFPDESRRVYYVHHAISAQYRALSGHTNPHEDPRERALPPLSAEQKGIDRRSDVAALCHDLESGR